MNENPPPNRAIGWYRFVLWLMPACVAMTSAIAYIWLAERMGLQAGPLNWRLMAFNFAATIGIGVYESMLRPSESRKIFESTVIFVGLQLFITPAIVVAAMFVLLSIMDVSVFSCLHPPVHLFTH